MSAGMNGTAALRKRALDDYKNAILTFGKAVYDGAMSFGDAQNNLKEAVLKSYKDEPEIHDAFPQIESAIADLLAKVAAGEPIRVNGGGRHHNGGGAHPPEPEQDKTTNGSGDHDARAPGDDGWKRDRAEEAAHPDGDPPRRSSFPELLPLSAFMRAFQPPAYVVDGILQRGRLYSFTSLTGHGKTSVSIYFGCMVAAGRPVGTLETFQGRVVILAGENPDDVCTRFHGACQRYDLNPAELHIEIMAGPFPITPDAAEELRQSIDAGGPTSLIIVDTAAAYFDGDNENDNVQAGGFARNLRVLTRCDGLPAVLVPSHPIKNSARDCLLPRGGGAFLNEVDVNLTLWSGAIGESTTMHWQGKIRGADFQPIDFQLHRVTLDNLRDAHGRPILTVVAEPLDELAADMAAKYVYSDENRVLEQLRRSKGISIANIARNCGWVGSKDQPLKSKVHRLLDSLKHDKLVETTRGKWKITAAGIKEIETIG